MPRRETPFLPDQYYHFYNRGNNRQDVFFERDNYLYFLRGIRKYLSGSVDVPAYCLIPTYYHLLVRVKPLLQPLPRTPPARSRWPCKSLAFPTPKPSTNASLAWARYSRGNSTCTCGTSAGMASRSRITSICSACACTSMPTRSRMGWRPGPKTRNLPTIPTGSACVPALWSTGNSSRSTLARPQNTKAL